MHRKVRAQKLYITPDAYILKLKSINIISPTEYKAYKLEIQNYQIDYD